MKKGSIAVSLAITLTGCLGYVPGQQSFWDAQVREMCAKDGGVTIYEKLRISESEIDLLGRVDGKIDVPIKQLAKPNAPAYAELKITNLQDGNPQVTRTESTITRRKDRVTIARWIVYSRFGGDLPSLAHPSTFRCPEIKKITSDLQSLFIVEGDLK